MPDIDRQQDYGPLPNRQIIDHNSYHRKSRNFKTWNTESQAADMDDVKRYRYRQAEGYIHRLPECW